MHRLQKIKFFSFFSQLEAFNKKFLFYNFYFAHEYKKTINLSQMAKFTSVIFIRKIFNMAFQEQFNFSIQAIRRHTSL